MKLAAVTLTSADQVRGCANVACGVPLVAVTCNPAATIADVVEKNPAFAAAFTMQTAELAGARLAILRQLIPSLGRLLVVHHGEDGCGDELDQLARLAADAGIEASLLEVNDLPTWDAASSPPFDAAYVVLSDATMRRTSEIAAALRGLPTLGALRTCAEHGATISLGAARDVVYKVMGDVVATCGDEGFARDPAVRSPTQIELAVNEPACRRFGLDPYRLSGLEDVPIVLLGNETPPAEPHPAVAVPDGILPASSLTT